LPKQAAEELSLTGSAYPTLEVVPSRRSRCRRPGIRPEPTVAEQPQTGRRLRHAHASWLLAGRSDLKSEMDRMGHAQITTTQKYLHALPDADQKNLDALNRTRGRHD
jgi:integrase